MTTLPLFLGDGDGLDGTIYWADLGLLRDRLRIGHGVDLAQVATVVDRAFEAYLTHEQIDPRVAEVRDELLAHLRAKPLAGQVAQIAETETSIGANSAAAVNAQREFMMDI